MSGESDLETLLKTLKVIRHDGVWRFHTFSNSFVDVMKLAFWFGWFAKVSILESEGASLVLPAYKSTPPDNRWVWLEMSVHSDLNAVGFLARIAAALSEAGVPCNAVAGYYHDHIFVPEDKADVAVAAIEGLAS